MTLRRIPHVVMPLPDEPFDSWVEFMSHSHTSTVGEMARALGLTAQEGTQDASAQSARAWSTALTPRQLDHLAEATGRSTAEFAGMTREVFAANAIRRTPQGRISASCPSSGIAGRYCPDCLADSHGRWRLSWQFPFGFVCIRHQRLLVDTCPRCAQPPRLIGHPLTLVPEPGRCHNRPRGAGNAIRLRCGADLADSRDARRASREMLGAQRVMLRIVASGFAVFGVYGDSRPRTIQVLSDFALLSRLGRQALVDGERFDWFDPDPEDLEVVRSRHAAGKVVLRPSVAQEVALGNTLAFMALQDERRLWELIRGRIGDHTALDHYSSTVRIQLSRALGRNSRPTTILQSQSAIDIAPEVRAAKVPAVLWPQWTAALSPRRLDPEIAGSALSAAVVFTGTHLTHGAAIRLLDPTAKGRQVSHVMRSLGHNAPEADTIRALIRLVTYLDERETPVDYMRRRAFDYSSILPAEEWRSICRDAGVIPGGGRRWQLARAYLYCRLSGNRLGAAPFSNAPSFPSVAELARFRDELPASIARVLDACGVSFLRSHGIDEPVTWMPALEVADLHPAGVESTSSSWVMARPARDAVERSHAALAYAAGQSMAEIAVDHGVARQTVGRVLDDAGVQTRRGRRRASIDTDWLRQRYLVDRRTIPEIAAEVGVAGMTINRHLANAGIARRPRGSASRATAIRVDPRAGDSKLLRRVLVGQDSVQRVERFLVVASHESLTAAAKDLGIMVNLLAAQMQRLSADAGGPLIARAFRGRPQVLTELGRELRTELARVLEADVSEGEGQVRQEEGSP